MVLKNLLVLKNNEQAVALQISPGTAVILNTNITVICFPTGTSLDLHKLAGKRRRDCRWGSVWWPLPTCLTMPLHEIVEFNHFGVWWGDAWRGVWPTPHRETSTNTPSGNSVRVSGCERYCQHYLPCYILFEGSRNVRTRTGRSHVVGLKDEEHKEGEEQRNQICSASLPLQLWVGSPCKYEHLHFKSLKPLQEEFVQGLSLSASQPRQEHAYYGDMLPAIK